MLLQLLLKLLLKVLLELLLKLLFVKFAPADCDVSVNAM
jgi:hypothetical protein